MEILIVDDETIIREGIQRTLKNKFPHFKTHLAANAEEALLILHHNTIQIALTDILMPSMTGLELMEIARKKHPLIKWVVISAYSEFSYAQEAVRLGVKDYLLKPIGKEMLTDMMEKLSEEIGKETAQTQEAEKLRSSQKSLREAVFGRWASGLDIGRIDLTPLMESFPTFYLIMVKMDSDRAVQLEHFIIENILGELIERYGKGFVTIHDNNSLLGLFSVSDEGKLHKLLDELRVNLVRCLRVPFQIMHSQLIEHYNEVPVAVQHMRQASATQVYEHYGAGGGDKAIDVALQYIRAHFQVDLSLEKVASIVYLNPVYFSQLFKQKTGHGFKEYVIHLRLEQAKQLLQNPALKLAEIAERIGYQDMRHFSQLFRKKFGVTPSEYRQSASDSAAE